MKAFVYSAFCVVFLVLLLSGIQTYAEGTKQLRPASTDSGALYVGNHGQGYANFARDGDANAEYRIFIKTQAAGEKILMGFSKSEDANDANYYLYNRAGTLLLNGPIPVSGDPGFIATYAKAVTGPFAGGYTPLSYTVPSINDTGTYYLYFDQDTDLLYFDITVVKPSAIPPVPSDDIPGRVFSKAWQFYCGGYTSSANKFNGKVFVYSDDGMVTRLDFKSMVPGAFTIFCNPTGCQSSGTIEENQKSRYGRVAYPQYKVFLNDPDHSGTNDKPYPSGETGILTQDPELHQGTPQCSGNMIIKVWVNKVGSVNITLDFPPPYADRTLQNPVNNGLNEIPWDGKDNAGTPIPDGTPITITVNYVNGRTNLPLYDIEYNNSGFNVTLVRPAPVGSPSPLIYWNDELINPSSSTCKGGKNLTGCTPGPLVTCHNWSECLGNTNTINTWWFSASPDPKVVYVFHEALPPLPVASNQELCGSGNATLTATVLSGEIVRWYDQQAPGGTLLGTGSPFVVNYTTPGIYHIYAEAYNPTSLCTSTTRKDITVTVVAVPAAPTGNQNVSRCGTGDITVTAVPGTSPTNTIDWYDADLPGGTLLLSGSLSYTFTGLAATTTIYAETRDPSTTLNCTSPVRTSFQARIKTIPAVSTTPASSSLCSGATTDIVLNSDAGSSLTWSCTNPVNTTCPPAGSGLPGDHIQDPLNAPTGGSYSYSIITILEGCSSSGQHDVLIYAFPDVSLADFPSVCLNTPAFQLSQGSPQGWGGVYSGTGVAAGFFNPLTAGIGSHDITYTYTDANGCTKALTKPIIVNPLPVASISGTTDVCQNGTAPLITFTGASATSPYIFTYNINGGSPQTVTSAIGNNEATVLAPTDVVGPFTYNLVSVQDGSSTACSQAQAGSATITVKPLPTASIAGTTEVCQNAAAPLVTFAGASATSPYTFTYNINGGSPQTITTAIGNNSVTVTAPTNVTGPFAYNLVSVQEGSSTACSQSQSGTATITVKSLPTAVISGTTEVCQDAASPLITFTGASATSPYTFTYNINGGSPETVTTAIGINTATIAAPTNIIGPFTYNLISVQEGSSTTCSQSQTGTATVTVKPVTPVTFTPCFDPVTVKNNTQKIILKGGYPIGPGGVFSGNGVSKNLISGNYEFDPNAVAANSIVTITYTYTNADICSDSKTSNIQVLPANADLIDATHMKDVRDNTIYTYKTIGAGASVRKWMTQGLNYGVKIPYTQTQSDKCTVQKYCFETIDPNCTTYGGSYQWDELMRYDQGDGSQGICPPGWHIPTEAEMQAMIDAEGGNSTASGAIQNSSELNVFLGGIYYLNNIWAYIPSGSFKASMFWTSTLATVSGKPVARGMNAQGLFPLTPSVSRYESPKANAFLLRCVRN